MANKKTWLGILVMALVFGMTVIGCRSAPRTPTSFQRGSASAGDTTILLRQGLDFERTFREVDFALRRHGFDTEMIQPEVGYIRTRWNTGWVRPTGGAVSEFYRVRIICNFNPNRTQLIVRAEAEYMENGSWVSGYDTRAIETLRTDLNSIVGN
jgi:hypothetical protein